MLPVEHRSCNICENNVIVKSLMWSSNSNIEIQDWGSKSLFEWALILERLALIKIYINILLPTFKEFQLGESESVPKCIVCVVQTISFGLRPNH